MARLDDEPMHPDQPTFCRNIVDPQRHSVAKLHPHISKDHFTPDAQSRMRFFSQFRKDLQSGPLVRALTFLHFFSIFFYFFINHLETQILSILSADSTDLHHLPKN
jgi:hypothetical protein